MAAPEALKPVGVGGGVGGVHSKQYNSFLTPILLPLVNYMQVFSFRLFFFCRSNKNVTIHKARSTVEGRETSLEEEAECAV